MAHSGVKTWASEADSLRDKIAEFEAKVRTLKDQLADMGFDEQGNDVRPKQKSAPPSSIPSAIRQSSSGEDLAEDLKTSPIESMESGSSVDELLEPSDTCDDLSNDLSALLNFAAESTNARAEVDRLFSTDATVIAVNTAEKDSLLAADAAPASAQTHIDIVQLVRAAANELGQATKRMDEIQRAREKTDGALTLSTPLDGPPQTSPTINSVADSPPDKLVESALLRHKELLESSRHLVKVATELTEFSRDDLSRLPLSESDDSLHTIDPVAAIPSPTWLNEVNADTSENELTNECKPVTYTTNTSNKINSANDVRLISEALRASSPRRTPRSNTPTNNSYRPRDSPEHLERRNVCHVRANSVTVTHRSRLDSLHGTPPAYLSAKNSRSVRFAALPPSYSANRNVGTHRQVPIPKSPRRLADAFPDSSAEPGTTENKLITAAGASALRDVRDDAEGTHRTERARRSERGESLGRRDISGPRNAPGRKVDPTDDRYDVSPRGGARSARFPRTQTPRRVVRRKEAIQRSVLEASSNPKKSVTAVSPPRSRIGGEGEQRSVEAEQGRGEFAEIDSERTDSALTSSSVFHEIHCGSTELTELDLREVVPFTNVVEIVAAEDEEKSLGSVSADDTSGITETVTGSALITDGDNVGRLKDDAPIDMKDKANTCIHGEALSDHCAHSRCGSVIGHVPSEDSATRDVLVVTETPQKQQLKDENFAETTGVEEDVDKGQTPLLKAQEDDRCGGSLACGESFADYSEGDGREDLHDAVKPTEKATTDDTKDNQNSESEAEEISVTMSEECVNKTSTAIGSSAQRLNSCSEDECVPGKDRVVGMSKAQVTDSESAIDLISCEGDITASEAASMVSQPAQSSLASDTVKEKGPSQETLRMLSDSRGVANTKTVSSSNSGRRGFVKKTSSLLGNKFPSRASSSGSCKETRSMAGGFSPRSHSSTAKLRNAVRLSPNRQTETKTAARVSPGVRPPRTGGFFAGQSAQWQQDLQSSGDVEGAQMRGIVRTYSNEARSTTSSKSSSRGASTSSARKSRVKSLRARLAAALK